MKIPSSSTSLSVTINFISSPIVLIVPIKAGSKIFSWLVTAYSKVPSKIDELSLVSSNSNL